MRYIPLQVNIPEPCHEDWEQMAPLPDGRRHCASCSRNLVDFSGMTDREIHQFLRQNEGKICGRWRRDQLSRSIYPIPPQRRGFRAAAVIGGLLAAANLAGQEKSTPVIELPVVEVADYHIPLIDQDVCGQGTTAVDNSFELQGQVVDEVGEPLVAAAVLIVGTERGTLTDQNGQFKLKVAPGQQIRVSYVGYETADWAITAYHQDQQLAIALVAGLNLPEVAVVAESIDLRRCESVTGMWVMQAIPVTVEEESEMQPFQDDYLEAAVLFPNPAIDYIGLELSPAVPTKMAAHLFNVHGQPLRSWAPRELEAGLQEQRFSISRLSLVPGHYYLVLEDQTGTMETRVVLVQ